MPTDGKQLESLVAYVEKAMLPAGFTVVPNRKVVDDDGNQIAEFDIEIRGKIGTTDFSWLIECRDRPSHGPAPGSWIEQLFGRRSRFGFNKVTAVSTTGFSRGAQEYAQQAGIELREVQAIEPLEFRKWLQIQFIEKRENVTHLHHATLIVHDSEPEDRQSALVDALSTLDSDHLRLKNSRTGKFTPIRSAFSFVVSQAGSLFDGLEPNGSRKKVAICAKYVNDQDHFVVEIPQGDVRISEIKYAGELSVRTQRVPLALAAEYRQIESGSAISQTVEFAPFEVHGKRLAIGMHRMDDTGEMHVTMRIVADEK